MYDLEVLILTDFNQNSIINPFLLCYNQNEIMTLFSSQEVTKNYRAGGFTLKKISVFLKPGQITGIVGENGNGKTTLLRIIAGDFYDWKKVMVKKLATRL